MRKRLLCCDPQRAALEFEKFRRLECKELNKMLFTKAFQVTSQFSFEICELQRRPRCT